MALESGIFATHPEKNARRESLYFYGKRGRAIGQLVIIVDH
jgi:hypothetical protein